MAKATDTGYENNLKDFAGRVKADPVQLPIQKVTPIQATTVAKEEQQLSVWIPKDMMRRLKIKGADTDKSLKEMVIEALGQFL
jgi:predicted metal-dependent phosphotriesterase family hydrolase